MWAISIYGKRVYMLNIIIITKLIIIYYYFFLEIYMENL